MLVAPTYCFYCGDDDETIVRVGAQENTQKFFMRKKMKWNDLNPWCRLDEFFLMGWAAFKWMNTGRVLL